MGRDGTPTRKKILKMAEKLIYQNGFAGTSVDLILEATGISKGAFFYHFKSKADLALAITQEFVKNDMTELSQVMDRTEQYKDDPKRRLLEFIDHFIQKFSGLEEPPSCIYASISNEQNQYDTEIRQLVNETLLLWRKVLLDLIKEVKAKHKPKVDIDTTALADQFNVIFEGAFIVSKSLDDTTITSKQLKLYYQHIDLLFE